MTYAQQRGEDSQERVKLHNALNFENIFTFTILLHAAILANGSFEVLVVQVQVPSKIDA